METKDKLLPCQQAMLTNREDINGWRVYRCHLTGRVCVISGYGQNWDLLQLACEECVKRPRHKARPPWQERCVSGVEIG